MTRNAVLDPLFLEPLEPLYDVPLMLNGGRVRGWRLGHPLLVQWVVDSSRGWPIRRNSPSVTGVTDEPVLLYAHGRRQPLFATAKADLGEPQARRARSGGDHEPSARHAWSSWSTRTTRVLSSRRSIGWRSRWMPNI